MRINADYVKENTKLKCESEYRYQNCSAIEKLLRNEKDKNVRNYAALQRNVELLDSKLQNRESVFIKEEEDKQTAIDVSNPIHL